LRVFLTELMRSRVSLRFAMVQVLRFREIRPKPEGWR
jgi:hypothetical protein